MSNCFHQILLPFACNTHFGIVTFHKGRFFTMEKFFLEKKQEMVALTRIGLHGS
ncbi:hypothetical protein SLEP1_g47092 [Rubroshorea leprosula]|uniref:Uncharacterized protein n=1 Tax=Rubroshorea leprosula TaxID=152421 RepID=A0AAV5LRW5_9ROSI|nr:hypothetical protein SLEP1_g47092 [Rubroshorea leprosula]